MATTTEVGSAPEATVVFRLAAAATATLPKLEATAAANALGLAWPVLARDAATSKDTLQVYEPDRNRLPCLRNDGDDDAADAAAAAAAEEEEEEETLKFRMLDSPKASAVATVVFRAASSVVVGSRCSPTSNSSPTETDTASSVEGGCVGS